MLVNNWPTKISNKDDMPEQILDQINLALNFLVGSFNENPDIYLTEEDLRCHLFMLLQQTVNINNLIFNTVDQSKSIPLHTEIRWYGDSGKLKYRSDIVMLDPRTLNTTEKIMKLPSKGYGFNSFWAIIELKLRRINGKSDNQFLKEITSEFNKLRKIQEETRYANKHQAEYFLLCFDKKKDIIHRINNLNEIIETKRINFHYVFK